MAMVTMITEIPRPIPGNEGTRAAAATEGVET